jgi:hypothetical protein
LKCTDEANKAFLGCRESIIKVINVTIQYECLRIAKLGLSLN